MQHKYKMAPHLEILSKEIAHNIFCETLLSPLKIIFVAIESNKLINDKVCSSFNYPFFHFTTFYATKNTEFAPMYCCLITNEALMKYNNHEIDFSHAHISLLITYYRLWKSIQEPTIVISGNICPRKNFVECLQYFYANLPEQWDIIYLCYGQSENVVCLQTYKNYTLWRTKNVKGHCAYLIHPKYCKCLCKEIFPSSECLVAALERINVEANIYVIHPSPIQYISNS